MIPFAPPWAGTHWLFLVLLILLVPFSLYCERQRVLRYYKDLDDKWGDK